ncbi:MAG: QueT transporter family protein, partial [Bacillota bacterium]
MTKTKYLIYGAMIAAIYFVLTYAVAPISSGLFQCRISEALCVLPYFTPAAVPGLFVGCLTANLIMMTTMGILPLDVIFGSL